MSAYLPISAVHALVPDALEFEVIAPAMILPVNHRPDYCPQLERQAIENRRRQLDRDVAPR